MRKVIVILLLILFCILDNALLPFLSIYGYYPSLLFLFALCFSIVNDKQEAIWVGIISGLLQDIYFMHGLGINALINMFMCLIGAHIGTTIFKEKSLIPVVTSFLLALLKGILLLCILYVMNIHCAIDAIFFNSVYSLVVSIFMYRWVYRLCQKPYMKKRWKFK